MKRLKIYEFEIISRNLCRSDSFGGREGVFEKPVGGVRRRLLVNNSEELYLKVRKVELMKTS